MRMSLFAIPILTLGLGVSVQAQEATEPSQLTIFSGPQGGSWYAMGGGMAQLFSEAGVRSNAEVGAGISNVVVVDQGRGELGFTMSIVPDMAAKGQPPFQDKITGIYGLANLGDNYVQLLVRKGTGITDVSGLKGQAFGSQPVGSVTAVALELVLSAYGLGEGDVEIVRGSQTYGANETKDRRIAGYTATSNPPTPSFIEVSETIDSTFLPISDAAFEQMKAGNSGFVRNEIPAGTYRGQDEAIPTASTALILMSGKQVTDDEAYWIVKTMAEKIEKLRTMHAGMREITVEDMAQVVGIELHPGARRYYEEVGAL
jgi:TRAP transporter TAXI family solute receptor